MSDLLRLLQSVKPYRLQLLGGVVMMIGVGFLEAVAALLIGPIFDRVLNPAAPDSTVALVTIPLLQKTVYLDRMVPDWIHNVWTVVSIFIVGVTLGKAICEYLANYLLNFVGFSVIMDLRNQLYERIINQSVSFFHRHSTGKLISTVINDIEKIDRGYERIEERLRAIGADIRRIV